MMEKSAPWIGISLLAVLVAAACGSGNGGAPDADEDAAEVDACDAIVAVDFPCRSTSYCRDLATIQNCRSAPCWEVVGHSCCTGGQCAGPTTTEACPAGTTCFEGPQNISYGRHGNCLPDPDAGDAADVDYDLWSKPDDGGAGCW